jgi:hypothetical protein
MDLKNIGYQYYSKSDMVALFRNDGCKTIEVLKSGLPGEIVKYSFE